MRSGHKTAGFHTSSRHDASRYHRETDSKRQSPGFLFLRKPIPTDYEIRICRTNTNEDGFPHVFSPIPQNKRTLKNTERQRGASGIRTVLTKVLTVFSKVPTVFPKVLIVFSLVQTAALFPPQQKSVGPTAIFSEREPAPTPSAFSLQPLPRLPIFHPHKTPTCQIICLSLSKDRNDRAMPV